MSRKLKYTLKVVLNIAQFNFLSKDCHFYFAQNNLIAYRNFNMTPIAVIILLNELKSYTTTSFQIGRRVRISTIQIINLFDKYVRVKRKQHSRILFSQEKSNLNILTY